MRAGVCVHRTTDVLSKALPRESVERSKEIKSYQREVID